MITAEYLAYLQRDVITPWCSDELHDNCEGHVAYAPCTCPCHTTPSTPTR